MAKWLRSGTRRDCCFLLADADDPVTAQRLKTRLESHYDDHIDPEQFYRTLDALVNTGHVERTADGIHDVYALTDAGEAALSAHVEWVRERVKN